MFLLYTSIPYVVFSIIFLVCGVIGNIFVFVLLLVLKEYKKSPTHLYILQLAVADFFFLTFIPFSISDHINFGIWKFGNGMCKAAEGIRYINYYASVLFITVMSLDRYIAVCRSSSDILRKLRTPTASIIISSVVWLISVSLSIPVMYFAQTEGTNPSCKCTNRFLYEDQILSLCLKDAGYTEFAEQFCKHTHPQDDGMCKYEGLDIDYSGSDLIVMTNAPLPLPQQTPGGRSMIWATYVWFNFIGMFILPILVMSVCYGLIVHKFLQKSFRGDSQNRREGWISDQKRLTLFCMSLVATFILCWISFHIFLIMDLYMKEFDGHFFLARLALTYLNSAINPYLYTFLSPGFKRQWRSFLVKTSRRRINPAQNPTTKMTSAGDFKDKARKESEQKEHSYKSTT